MNKSDPTTYNTGRDNWTHGDRMLSSAWHRFKGPCPRCGYRTFDYGGMWACVNYRCASSPEHIVCNAGPEPAWWNTDIQVTLDGDSWCAVGAGFLNIQESPCGFGDTPDLAVRNLR